MTSQQKLSSIGEDCVEFAAEPYAEVMARITGAMQSAPTAEAALEKISSLKIPVDFVLPVGEGGTVALDEAGKSKPGKPQK